MNHPHTAGPTVTTIAPYNDEFRSTFEGSKVLMSAAVYARAVDVRAAAIVASQAFTVFNKDSDPYQEHDFGSFALVSEMFFRKIDYCDKICTYASEDPCDPDKTTRVLPSCLHRITRLRYLGATFIFRKGAKIQSVIPLHTAG